MDAETLHKHAVKTACDSDDLPGELICSGSCCGGAAAGMVSDEADARSDEADARSDVEADAF